MEGEKRSVLVVDDDAAHRYSIRRRLELAGFLVLEAGDGEEALRLAAGADAVILDVRLPDMTGFDVCRKLREDDRLIDVPIIHISGAYIATTDLVEGLRGGADAYLTRPVDDEVVVANLQATLRLRDNLRQLTRELDKKRRDEEQARDLFMAVLGHDLRNPLDAIAMSAMLLARAPLSAEQLQKTTLRISSATRRMAHMLDDIQDYARSRLGTDLVLNRTQHQLSDLVAAAVDELRAAYPRALVSFVGDGSGAALWDAPRLQRVIMNLLRNAVQHGEEGREVTIRLRSTEAAQVFTVHNHGAPISKDVMARLFQPMVKRADAAPDASNMGLGLFVCSEIVGAHGGTIHVTSDDTGTEFGVELPRVVI